MKKGISLLLCLLMVLASIPAGMTVGAEESGELFSIEEILKDSANWTTYVGSGEPVFGDDGSMTISDGLGVAYTGQKFDNEIFVFKMKATQTDSGNGSLGVNYVNFRVKEAARVWLAGNTGYMWCIKESLNEAHNCSPAPVVLKPFSDHLIELDKEYTIGVGVYDLADGSVKWVLYVDDFSTPAYECVFTSEEVTDTLHGQEGYFMLQSANGVALTVSPCALPEEAPATGFTYTVSNGEATITGYEGTLSGDVVIPSDLGGYLVTTIGTHAFRECTGLKTVTIPDSVTIIENGAFSYCTNLTDITLPKGIDAVENNVFLGCTALKTVTLPEGLNAIKHSAFMNCTGLENIVVPYGATVILGNAFNGCTNLTEITIPKSIKYIGEQAFDHCTNLTDVYYGGLEENWNNITIQDSNNEPLLNANIHFYKPEFPQSGTWGESGSWTVDSSGVLTMTGSGRIPDYEFDAPWSWLTPWIKSVSLDEEITGIGRTAFAELANVKELTIPKKVTHIAAYACYGGLELNYITLPNTVTEIMYGAFGGCSNLSDVYYDGTEKEWNQIVIESVNENLTSANIHFKEQAPEENPEIEYGTEISGTVLYSDGTPVKNGAVTLSYANGAVKEETVTDSKGAYRFSFAEVGDYLIKVEDEDGLSGTAQVSVKRKNDSEVFLSGKTNITLKKTYSISGTVTPADPAEVTLTDSTGRVLAKTETKNGSFKLEKIANGTYYVKAESQIGSSTAEVTVYNGDVTKNLTISAASAMIQGYVDVEERDFKRWKRHWADVMVFDSQGVLVASGKTDVNGSYFFKNLPFGSYTVVAMATERRPDHHHGYQREFELIGYAHAEIKEKKLYKLDTIVLTETESEPITLSGKVTAEGEPAEGEVTLRDVFGHEIGKTKTDSNGVYAFRKVRNGLYLLTAVTEEKGTGFTVAAVINGQIYGTLDIKAVKAQAVLDREEGMKGIPECQTRDEALKYKDKISNEKKCYDGLSEKEKKQCSKWYVERLNKLTELLAQCEYQGNGGTLHQGAMAVSSEELESGTSVTFILNVEPQEKTEIGEDGVTTDEEYVEQLIQNTAGDKELGQYYEITLTKKTDETEQVITNVSEDTNTTGKMRITIPIPEEHKGHDRYYMIHVHEGVPVTLIDLDDDPDTMTFEVDKFSTFALAYSDVVKYDVAYSVGNHGILLREGTEVTGEEQLEEGIYSYQAKPESGYEVETISVTTGDNTVYPVPDSGEFEVSVSASTQITVSFREKPIPTIVTESTVIPDTVTEGEKTYQAYLAFATITDVDRISDYGMYLNFPGGQMKLEGLTDEATMKLLEAGNGKFAFRIFGEALKNKTVTLTPYIIAEGKESKGETTQEAVYPE